MKLEKVYKDYKALFCIEEGMLFSKGHTVYVLDGQSMVPLFSFPISIANKILNFSKLFYRLNRSGVGSSIDYGRTLFFSYDKKIFSFDLNKKRLKCEYLFSHGRGPLKYLTLSGIVGFDDGVYFGEYFGNHKRATVDIVKRDHAGVWSSVYRFQSGEINHVHALIADPIRNCVWILAGDFEHSASIWMATNNFETVVPILRGEQIYRACVAFPLKDGLLYATDTQIENNSLRVLTNENNSWLSKEIATLNGSCIYGTELKDYYVFSTSTEPCDKKKGKILRLLDNKPAPGILANRSDVVTVNKLTNKVETVASKSKDIWPYRLFQFGTIMFADNYKSSNNLFLYNVGSKDNDLSTEHYDLSS